MTKSALMSGSRVLVWLVVCSFAGRLLAQDALPATLAHERTASGGVALVDTVLDRIHLPTRFVGVGSNIMTDTSGGLSPVFERMYLLREGMANDSLRIVHVGDSHIYGRVYPRTVDSLLQHTFGAVSYANVGKNGATNLTFARPEQVSAIAKLKPELLILSFGTNESHNRKYNKSIHYQQIDKLVKMLRDSLPETPILLTTPPGSYESFRHRRRRSYVVNPRTSTAAKVISDYAAENQLAVWDLYNIVGGSRDAVKNWQSSGLMRPDHVHYTPEGYTLQGELLYGAIIKAYNTYVSHKY